jgi:hypothetical protein
VPHELFLVVFELGSPVGVPRVILFGFPLVLLDLLFPFSCRHCSFSSSVFSFFVPTLFLQFVGPFFELNDLEQQSFS